MRTLDDLHLTEEEFKKIKEEINTKETKDTYKKYKEEILEHQKYVGKCYKEKDKDKYLMIISARSSNQYRVEALIFEFPVKFEKNYHLTKIFRADNIFMTLDFEGIHVEDYPLLCNNIFNKKGGGRVIDCLEEITKEEFYSKMDEYLEELKKVLDSNTLDIAEELKTDRL